MSNPTSSESRFDDLAHRSGFSVEAVRTMHAALQSGGGGMAQFSHAEFGGSGQWMRGGMTMVGDMFNHDLKDRVSRLADELSGWPAERAPVEAGGGAPRATHGDWWPQGLGHPNSAGAQNGVRYAYFGEARRLAIERDGCVTVYDTQDHRIGGVSQQQSHGSSLAFASQHGTVDLTQLPVVPDAGATPADTPAQAEHRPGR